MIAYLISQEMFFFANNVLIGLVLFSQILSGALCVLIRMSELSRPS